MKYLIFCIFFLLFIKINNYIVIPFNQLKSEEQLEEFKDAEELLNHLSVLKLYADFYLGLYPHKLPTLLSQNIYFFTLTKNQKKELISSDNYSPSASESLKILDKNNKINLYNNKQEYI